MNDEIKIGVCQTCKKKQYLNKGDLCYDCFVNGIDDALVEDSEEESFEEKEQKISENFDKAVDELGRIL